MMQTILGAGGAIGKALARNLTPYTSTIRLVSRKPEKVNPGDELMAADLLDPEQVRRAVDGSEVCYLTVGFKYSTKVWQQQWPQVIRNVTQACLENGCRLVFFDNIYALSKDHLDPITEESPVDPPSRKGEIRAQVFRMIMDAVEKKNLQAIIARAPDFFGPVRENSVLMNLVYENLLKGKKAQWFCNADVTHSVGYAPELAKGTAMLGNTTEAYNQVWNLPTSSEPITGREWVSLFAEQMDGSEKVQVLPAWSVRLLGLFIPILKESVEMLYQYDRNYLFDSSKFNARFNHTPVSNREAVKLTLQELTNA